MQVVVGVLVEFVEYGDEVFVVCCCNFYIQVIDIEVFDGCIYDKSGFQVFVICFCECGIKCLQVFILEYVGGVVVDWVLQFVFFDQVEYGSYMLLFGLCDI